VCPTACQVLQWNNKVIGVALPSSLEFEITQCDPPSGDTKGKDKSATLDTGAVITVPAFLKQGEIITVNTEKGEYMGRVNKK
jgi:hypothetical protein